MSGLTVVGRPFKVAKGNKNSPKGYCRAAYVVAECRWCGTRVIADNCKVKKRVSCGCRKKHGMTGTAAYTVWVNMKQRCQNPNIAHFARYGGRGIKVCDEWQDFEVFLKDMGQPKPGMTIERIDNDGDYTAANCRWATPAEQCANRRSTRILQIGGQSHCVKEWSRISGTPRSTITNRLNRGVDPRSAVFG